MLELKFGDYLVEKGVISEGQLKEALARQKEFNDRVGNLLVKLGFISEETMIDSLADYLSVEKVSGFVNRRPVQEVPVDLVRKYRFFPLDADDRFLYIVTSDPLDVNMTDELKYRLNKREIVTYLATSQEIEIALHRWYSEGGVTADAGEIAADETPAAAAEESLDGPAIRFFNSIMDGALLEKASDVHIEPEGDKTVIRYRIDGSLQVVNSCSPRLHESLVSRIKVQSGIDITVKTVPQDGKMSMSGGDIDLRVSTLPTIRGEKVVIRILDHRLGITGLEELGYTSRDYSVLGNASEQPYGMIVITGPTGSGKTTTLYSLLDRVRSEEVNVVTIEDPPEQHLKGISQVAIDEKRGITFASVLRSILRQDPDIIMVGEIRDEATASLATRAALTGHLVLSTLHTNDSASAPRRLIDMEAEPYQLSSALVCVAAQRLARTICPACREKYTSRDLRLNELFGEEGAGEEEFYRGQGCSRCSYTGFKGRTAVTETIRITREIREIIKRGGNAEEVREAAEKDGFVSMMENVKWLVQEGVTTPEEGKKVAFSLE